MIFKTDEILENFQLFKDIRLLLEEYLDETGLVKVPSISELYSRNMYYEWMELASLMASTDNWDKSDWDNFVACMSLAEATKSTSTSICYALTGLGVVMKDKPEYSIENNSLEIKIEILKNMPYIDRMKELLQRCLEFLLFTKNSDITIIIKLLELSADNNEKSGFSAEVNLAKYEETNSIYSDIDINKIGLETDILKSGDYYVIYADTTSEYDGSYNTYEFRIVPEDLKKFDSSYYKIQISYTIPVGLPKSDLPYVTYDMDNNLLMVLKGKKLQYGVTYKASVYLDCLLLTAEQIANTRKEVHIIWQ